MVEWEVSGTIPVEAKDVEEAKRLAQDAWHKWITLYSSYDVDFDQPKEVKTLEEAYSYDTDIADVKGDCCVEGSHKSLKDLLPNKEKMNDKI